VNMTFTSRCQIGLDFFEYLTETNRTVIDDKIQLRDIYNNEFRTRDSNFSSVLYAMKICKKAIIRGNKVSFTKQVGTLKARTFERLTLNRSQFWAHMRYFSFEYANIDSLFGTAQNDLSSKQGSLTLSVKNIGQEVVFFTYYTPLYWLKCLKLSDAQGVTKQKPLQLSPGDFRCNEVGYYPATLAFEFKKGPQKSSDVFHIVRTIEAQCVTSLGLELGAEAPYRANSLPAWTPQNECRIVDGQPPEGLSVMKLKNEVQLKQYKVPQYMEKLIEVLKMPKFISESRYIYLLESPLSWENYAEKFHLMLYLEELQMEVDIRSYNIPNSSKEHAVLSADPRIKHLLVLEVPGVSENRPSVLRGDALLVYPQGETGVKYRGYVHGVLLDSVKLGFASDLLQGIKFNVEFVISRLILRLQHRAAELALTHQLGSVLFPDALPCSCPEPDLPQLKLFDRKLEKNPEQYRAVQQIVTGSSRPAPYLVFGPPGTGTSISSTQSCSSSHSRKGKVIPAVKFWIIMDVSNLVGECYEFPTKEKLMEYKIMVTTLLTAGRLVSGAIPVGHFTHVFVDEAGHAVETECLVPLAGEEDEQLDLNAHYAPLPFIHFKSLLERLMKNFPLYQKNEGVFNSRFVTKLLRNYRSHPAILKIPNELFYDGELQPCAEEYSRSSYCYWRHLPKTDFPVIFHGVAGRDERENTSPSFFNVAEIEVLMDYVQKLLEAQGKKGEPKIAPKDIGIIAPYRKQVQKIRRALEKVAKNFKSQNMNALKVGSVEEFQGQERRVILVSTVRSSSEYMEFDKKFSLGFVKNEKRFNVAVTRAQALLIVVGNPVVLKTDHTWARYAEETDESAVQRYQSPEWRHDI
uniref:RNA helicase n=1 Tax=Oryzias melastigma TaxID=30732 RepID=A0A3B3DLL0_ORYME